MSRENLYMKFRIWCVIGLLLSTYATYVEVKAESDVDYVALCDLAPKVSCTAVFTSRYGRGFGLTQYIFNWSPPNGVMGITFYVLQLLLSSQCGHGVALLQLFLCFISNWLSIYLAYLLYFVLDDLCVVCASIYVANFFCLIEFWRIYKHLWCVNGEVSKTD